MQLLWSVDLILTILRQQYEILQKTFILTSFIGTFTVLQISYNHYYQKLVMFAFIESELSLTVILIKVLFFESKLKVLRQYLFAVHRTISKLGDRTV